ncbi:hypothetical protein GCM10011408_19310 [Dyella caseinilytica]|nr:hypothetical protein GCM10011408_19310 [Dyella caseinilytica]
MLITMLSGCFASDNTMSLDVVGYNHTDHDIGYFSVNNAGGAYEGKHEGGKSVCCISISEKYKPGMTVTVRWGGLEIGTPQQRTVEVPPYHPDDGGEFHVHFLRDGNVKVFVTRYMLWHPNYPLKGDEAKL